MIDNLGMIRGSSRGENAKPHVSLPQPAIALGLVDLISRSLTVASSHPHPASSNDLVDTLYS